MDEAMRPATASPGQKALLRSEPLSRLGQTHGAKQRAQRPAAGRNDSSKERSGTLYSYKKISQTIIRLYKTAVVAENPPQPLPLVAIPKNSYCMLAMLFRWEGLGRVLKKLQALYHRKQIKITQQTAMQNTATIDNQFHPFSLLRRFIQGIQ